MAIQASASSVSDFVELSEEGLISLARQKTGLSDFGDESFREGFRVLLRTYDTSARLSSPGRRSVQKRLLELLCNRLRIERAFKQHPEIREREIRRPIYLTGLPRTGTSALFNILGADPASRPLLYWEGLYPDPAENLVPGEPDPRLVLLRESLERAQKKNPEFTKIHFVQADGPEECIQLLAHTFNGPQMGIEPLMSPYREWFEAQDLRAPYAYYADLLRLIDWQRPGERWLLKSPAHLWALDVLVEMFPDACIIQTHRNPLQIIGSYCSMIMSLMRGREGVDPFELGPAVLEYLARSVERAMEARDAVGKEHFVDIDYHRFVKDPLGAAKQIYETFGLELSSVARYSMIRHVESSPKGKHGSHDYNLAEYGLSREAVTERLAAYVDRFGVPVD